MKNPSREDAMGRFLIVKEGQAEYWEDPVKTSAGSLKGSTCEGCSKVGDRSFWTESGGGGREWNLSSLFPIKGGINTNSGVPGGSEGGGKSGTRLRIAGLSVIGSK